MAVRVLVVDDDATTLMILSVALEKHGYDVKSLNGGFGLASVIRNYRPQVILLDVDMPGLSGDQALEAATQVDPSLQRDIRVLLHSALPTTQLARMCQRLDVEGYIEKPATPEWIAEHIAELVPGSLAAQA